MISMRLREVHQLTGGELHVADALGSDPVVDGLVTTDSRDCRPGSLFVARVGEFADGHDFVPAAAGAGAVAALTSRPVEALPAIVVDDVQLAFGRLARGVIDRAPDLHVVAVTGSSGKTSTKDLLAAVLAPSGETVAPVNSLNGEIGVPLTVCRVTPATRHLVIEMGARGLGHIDYLTRIAPPDIAIVLNVGSAHLGEFGSLERIAVAKAELPRAVGHGGLAILNADDPVVTAMVPGLRCRVVFVGTSDGAGVRADRVTLDERGRAAYTLVTDVGEAPVRLRQVGAHHVGNSLAVAAAALELGVPLDQVAVRLSSATPASRWRMEVTDRSDGVVVVNDAYNANPESMRAALDALAAVATAGRRWAVLGEMLELGPAAASAHAQVGEHARALGIDQVVAVGEGARAFGAPTWLPDTDAAFAHLSANLRRGDVVLLKSSRDSGLRWLGDRLARPGESADETRGAGRAAGPARAPDGGRGAGAR